MNYNLSNLPIGIFNRFECQYLAELVSQVPDHGVIVEVGSLLGRTSVIIGRHAKENVKIFCIDKFPENFQLNFDMSKRFDGDQYPKFKQVYNTYEIFKNNTVQFKNITPIIGDSPYSIEYTPEPIDMFFLDVQENVKMLENMYGQKAIIFPASTLWMIRKPQ